MISPNTSPRIPRPAISSIAFIMSNCRSTTAFWKQRKTDLSKFVTWSDNPGLVLSYIDATNLPEGQLAQQYTLCDNFFHSAYGGSFLNHQFLIAANAPQWTQS